MQKTLRSSPRREAPIRIRTSSQYDAIASPVRDQILQVVVNQAPPSSAQGGVSIREIASQLGRRPASLYRHIESLKKAGLIQETGVLTSGGRDATTYTAAGDYVLLETPEGDKKAAAAMSRFIRRTAAHAGKEHAEASRRAASASSNPREPADRAMLAMFGWLDPAQERRLHQHLLAAARIFGNARRRPGTKLLAATMFIRPVLLPGGTTAAEPHR